MVAVDTATGRRTPIKTLLLVTLRKKPQYFFLRLNMTWTVHWRDIKNVENHKMKMISSVGFLQLLVIWLFCARVFTSPHHRLAAWLTVVKFIFWHLYPHSLHIYENMSARDGENKAESINSRASHLPHTSCLGGIRNIFWRMHTT